jgi:hypothetical protein
LELDNMLGWWIVVDAATSEARDQGRNRESVLAQWEIGLGGIAWLDELVAAGKAKQLIEGGYPSRYSAKASDILPLIVDGPPRHSGPPVVGDDYALPPNWVGKFELHAERVVQCLPDQILTIDAWDQS